MLQKTIACCKTNSIATIPLEGKYVCLDEISQINGLSHGVGACPPQQGACKITLNVKNGIIEEALIETVGCSGITQSALIAAEILVGKNLLEALNTHLVCDAINVAMKNIFNNYVYGRTQTAFSKNGLPVGATFEELASGKISYVGTAIATKQLGPRILSTAEGYIYSIALDSNDYIIGYRYFKLGDFLRNITKGIEGVRLAGFIGEYGRYSEGKSFIDPREE